MMMIPVLVGVIFMLVSQIKSEPGSSHITLYSLSHLRTCVLILTGRRNALKGASASRLENGMANLDIIPWKPHQPGNSFKKRATSPAKHNKLDPAPSKCRDFVN